MLAKSKKHLSLYLFLVLFGVTALANSAQAGRGDTYRGYTGKMYAINVPDVKANKQLTLNEAKGIVKKYRWIHVNASVKDLRTAQEMADKTSNVLGGKPLVLVYLPRFIDNEDRNTYPAAFQNSMRELLKSVYKDNRQVLVTAKSYAVHQTLRVLREFEPNNFLFIGISPALGAFGNYFSRNVKDHINDVERTKTNYCMIASKRDGNTWRRGGAAYKRSSTYRGDPDIGRAKDNNSENVHIVVLDSADHKLADYIKYGLGYAMEQCAYHFNMHDTAIGQARRNYGNEISKYKIDCNIWCEKNKPRCLFCSTKADCGVGYDDIKSWKGKGINWHACEKRRSRKEASKSNEEACKAWCKSNPECKYCSTNSGCGFRHKSMKSWTGYGRNWHACRRR